MTLGWFHIIRFTMINWLCYWFWFGHSFLVFVGVGSSWEPNASLGRHVNRDFMIPCASGGLNHFRLMLWNPECVVILQHVVPINNLHVRFWSIICSWYFMVFLQCMLQLPWYILMVYSYVKSSPCIFRGISWSSMMFIHRNTIMAYKVVPHS